MEWGAAIEVNGVQPDWLRDDEVISFSTDRVDFDVWPYSTDGVRAGGEWAWSIIRGIRLPAEHPYYTVQAHNAKHGTNFAYWPGELYAPDDWDGGEILFRAGSTSSAGDWIWSRYGESCEPGHIIGYTRKAVEKPVDDHVSVKRITESEADKLIRDHDYDIVKVLDSLGIIRPCTREERFTQETGITVTPDVRAALEWSKEND